jgi:hypothetical protein
MGELDIFYLFVFVVSCTYVANQLFKIVARINSKDPKQINYSGWEKISNYFFVSYFITYFITNII